MKTIRILTILTTAFLFVASKPCFAADKEDKPSAEDLALVKGFTLKGTVKQSMGSFNGEGNHLEPGATFELDLSNLPKEKIQFTLPEGRSGFAGYIHFDAPIEIVKVKGSKTDRVGIYLSANDSEGELRIQIVADLPPEKGSWCSVSIYREGSGGFISSSMAEASGELNVKESVSGDLQPKTNEPAPEKVSQVAPPFKPGMKNVEPPTGSLGYKIGSYLTIEGVREEEGKVGNQTLRVDTINGHKLDQPVAIWMNGVELPEKERCIFKGYETGEWIGVPVEVLHATGLPAPQAGWQFHFSFSPTSVEQPKNLEIK